MSYAQAATALIPAITGALGTFATDYDAQYANVGNPSDTAARIASMDMVTQEYMYKNNVFYQQTREVERTLGDMMSERGRQAMQQAASVAAAGAVSGTSGGTTDAASFQAFVDAELDNTIMISQGGQTKTDLARRALFDKISTNNKLTGNINNNVINNTSGDTSFAPLAGALGGITGSLGMMSDSQRSTAYDKIDSYFKPEDNSGQLYEGGATGWY